MKLNRKLRNIFAVAVSTVIMTGTFSSCNDWLNVTPSNQVAADEMFSTEEGFTLSLNGVYTLMTGTSLYGRDMTFGAVDYIGDNWTAAKQYSTYEEISTYDYESSDAQTTIDAMWSAQYNAIANINNLMLYIDENKDVFTSERIHSLVKGEALALRAYLHLDILRLYSPYTFGETGETGEKWLPYVDEFTRYTTISITNTEFAERIMDDIDAAIELLKDDPILTGVSISSTYFNDRTQRMNYYAAVALKARAALYTGDKAAAAVAAQEVVDAQSTTLFRWITASEVTYSYTAHRDRTFSTEHIFALNIHDMKDKISSFFETSSSIDFIGVKYESLFDASDYRSTFVVNGALSKLNQPEEESGAALEQKNKRMPMLRISEMYYILAEALNDVSYLNEVRYNRGLEEEIPQDGLVEALDTEIYCEFIGEGQRFAYLKRLNKDVTGIRYTLPMTDTEVDYGGRPDATE